jgi:hypothetical protein
MRTPPLTPETEGRIEVLFPVEHRAIVRDLLLEECGNNLPFLGRLDSIAMDRVRFAALKLSDGDLEKLCGAIRLAKTDWRDLLVAAGFANNIEAHKKWQPCG